MKYKNLIKINVLLILIFIQGCSYLDTEKIGRVLSTDYYELDTTPKDAERYQCDQNKQFFLKDIKSDNQKIDKWIIFKNKEYRLIQSEPGAYENELIILVVDNLTANIKPKKPEFEEFSFSNCNRVSLK
ncbi:MAG: hypothetical protein O3A03_03725 [Proteobacteria bacterium]|nr:hypothetical protein [Pseudomonadota bacterium]MDA1034598.1 hypothetical protein [Pseudomonadota bacterium]